MSDDTYLRVFYERSELYLPGGRVEVFLEGPMDSAARQRAKKIQQQLADGYLERRIVACRSRIDNDTLGVLTKTDIKLLNNLVHAVTSEVGRALLALTIMQLCIKAIDPQQSIRLHKGGTSSTAFSWRSGISMRSLDNKFITPTLRKYDLLKLNNDGFMMTRSLAENYPYSSVYKAHIRGARDEWIQIVEAIEANTLQPEPALDYLLATLVNQAEFFQKLANQAIVTLEEVLRLEIDKNFVFDIIDRHIKTSNYAARLMEIAMHSLFQAMLEVSALMSMEVKPLSQMRSANKKHGNIGDVELLEHGEIVEAWDAKYGKTYLRDELEELADKLVHHQHVLTVGFVTSGEVERLEELTPRLEDIEGVYHVRVEIVPFSAWILRQFQRVVDDSCSEAELAGAWLRAYTASIAQKRRDVAPIDEPCAMWLQELQTLLAAEAHS